MPSDMVTLRLIKTPYRYSTVFEILRGSERVAELDFGDTGEVVYYTLMFLTSSLTDKYLVRNFMKILLRRDLAARTIASELRNISHYSHHENNLTFPDISSEATPEIDCRRCVEHDSAFQTTDQTIQAACAELFSRYGVRVEVEFSCVDKFRDVWVYLRVAEGEKEFCFWRHFSWLPPGGTIFDLYIIPQYHPCREKKCKYMINGDTDYLVRPDCGIKTILPPADLSVTKLPIYDMWKKEQHPARSIGKNFGMTLAPFLFRTQESKNTLVELMISALGLDDKYVAVSGGFRPRLTDPSNVFLSIPKPQGIGEIRGSEGCCVAMYRQLQAEGMLEGSYIPKWFLDENWLGIYEQFETVRRR